jgi:hypothetical protein
VTVLDALASMREAHDLGCASCPRSAVAIYGNEAWAAPSSECGRECPEKEEESDADR